MTSIAHVKVEKKEDVKTESRKATPPYVHLDPAFVLAFSKSLKKENQDSSVLLAADTEGKTFINQAAVIAVSDGITDEWKLNIDSKKQFSSFLRGLDADLKEDEKDKNVILLFHNAAHDKPLIESQLFANNAVALTEDAKFNIPSNWTFACTLQLFENALRSEDEQRVSLTLGDIYHRLLSHTTSGSNEEWHTAAFDAKILRMLIRFLLGWLKIIFEGDKTGNDPAYTGKINDDDIENLSAKLRLLSAEVVGTPRYDRMYYSLVHVEERIHRFNSLKIANKLSVDRDMPIHPKYLKALNHYLRSMPESKRRRQIAPTKPVEVKKEEKTEKPPVHARILKLFVKGVGFPVVKSPYSDKLHYSNCKWALKISNQIRIPDTNHHYSFCQHCTSALESEVSASVFGWATSAIGQLNIKPSVALNMLKTKTCSLDVISANVHLDGQTLDLLGEV
jgi:hypothetical protein